MIGIKNNKSPINWNTSVDNLYPIDIQKTSSPVPKTWTVTPVKLTPTINCKKKLDFYSEPLLYKNIGESVHSSIFIFFKYLVNVKQINTFILTLEITKKTNASTSHTVQSGNDLVSSAGIHNYQIFGQ